MAQWEAKSTGTNANRFAGYDQDPGGDWGDSNWDESGNLNFKMSETIQNTAYS
jgi:hypothetical protein